MDQSLSHAAQSLSHAAQYLNIADSAAIQFFKNSLTKDTIANFIKDSDVWVFVHIFGAGSGFDVKIFTQIQDAEKYISDLMAEIIDVSLPGIEDLWDSIQNASTISEKIGIYNDEYGFDNDDYFTLERVTIN